jgi:hypothetical protein
MLRRLASVVWLAIAACTNTESATSHIPVSYDAPAYCVTGDDELVGLVRDALSAWRVGAPVYTSAQRDCVAVYMVQEYEDTRVGETTWSDNRVESVTVAWWWWEICPDARRAVVLHEIGHSLGYWGHQDGPSAMAPGVDCQGHEYLPTASEIALARRVRAVWRYSVDGGLQP